MKIVAIDFLFLLSMLSLPQLPALLHLDQHLADVALADQRATLRPS
jgi:hypothetical protein